ncbi:MrcB family domain-containing protein [Pseudomonas sp. Marseille-Q8238]
MNLKQALEKILSEYVAEKESNSFAGNPLAEFIRTGLPKIINSYLGSYDRFLVKGSAGKGVWTSVPWVAILDKTVTDTPQKGFYLVYLFCEDGSGLYLSLNQGVTDIKRQYGSSVKNALKVKAVNYVAKVPYESPALVIGPIDLKSVRKMSLGELYESGAIYSRYYQVGALPSNSELEAQLNEFIDLYLALVINQSSQQSSVIAEDDEEYLSIEECTELREHKRIERNQKLAKKVKELQGYVCRSCGFDFEKKYGALGKGFIEAHHLTPVSTLKGRKIGLDPRKDFTVLCSNCHRMIHKTEFVGRVEEFKAVYVVA